MCLQDDERLRGKQDSLSEGTPLKSSLFQNTLARYCHVPQMSQVFFFFLILPCLGQFVESWLFSITLPSELGSCFLRLRRRLYSPGEEASFSRRHSRGIWCCHVSLVILIPTTWASAVWQSFFAINLFTSHNKKILVSDYENILFLLSSSSPLFFYHVDTVIRYECVCRVNVYACAHVCMCAHGGLRLPSRVLSDYSSSYTLR